MPEQQLNQLWPDHSTGLFQPDILLPIQVFTPRNGSAPEKRLMAAVLEDAINCFQKYRSATNRRGRRFFREASEWLMADDTTWEFSFQNICSVLNLDVDYVRRGLRNWQAQQPPLIESVSSPRGAHATRAGGLRSQPRPAVRFEGVQVLRRRDEAVLGVAHASK